MNFNPLVSIIIPVYNGSNYVKEAIDSALAQTYNNIEIIVVNDGSTDNTEEIVKSYGDKVRYFYKENGGTSTALNLAIKNMKGDYFSWLSHDDMYYPDKIKIEVEELSKLDNKETVIMADVEGINEKYETVYKTNYIDHINAYPPRAQSMLHPIIYNQTHGCTLLIAKTCFDKVGLFDEKVLIAQDFEFFYRLFKKFPHKLVSQILIKARHVSTSQGMRAGEKRNIEYSKLFISIMENFTEDDFKLLAKTKLDFYREVAEFYNTVGYTIALDYVHKKMMKNIQINVTDLIGNKFNGYDLHLYLRDRNIDSDYLTSIKDSDDIHTHKYFDIMNIPNTENFIKSEFFLYSELIHMHIIHNALNNIIDLNYLPIMSKLKPIIWSIHDPWVLGGHCVYHFDCEKWKDHCYDCNYLDKPFIIENDDTAFKFEMKKQAIKDSNIVAIVASKCMEDKLKESPIWKDKKIYRIPYGINQDIFKPRDINEAKRELEIPENSITLMFRADAGPLKGADIIKKALKNIKTNSQISLIILGFEIDKFKDLESSYNIKFYNWIKDDNFIAKLYQACDIFLMPSRQEAFGAMAIEAMSCGKMVLSIEGTSLPEVINSPECGLACKEEEYTNKLQYFIDNLNEVKERGKKSLDFAIKNYNKDLYTDRTIEVYKKTISEHKIDNEYGLIIKQLKQNYIEKVKEKLMKDYIDNVNNNDTNNNYYINNSLINNNNNIFGIYIINNEKYFIINILGIKITIKKKAK
ncbi:glycosyltransferase [Brachyspira murdochii]|uniref:Glycosyl transferase family 2 n=1 Tax=Brachyspira murdochii (strain ATCC 51284 / DSM 12563 / 56-150) TaxID=526224 RepID=D5U4J8_BRAM5|nr:glycosyltransferase [Brachyspira murdochii]ADG70243.1 glycosyl transferase family 2 [Brachyspira murdochii DSM 12563]